MKTLILIILLVAVSTQAADVRLAWDANAEADLAGYKVYIGDSEVQPFTHAVLNAGKVTSLTIPGLQPGHTFYFAATAYNTSGQESGYSNVVTAAIPALDITENLKAVPEIVNSMEGFRLNSLTIELVPR